MNEAFQRMIRWMPPMAAIALVATGCSSNVPASVQDAGGTGGSGGADAADSSLSFDTGAGGAHALTPISDGGLSVADAETVSADAALCGGPIVLWPQQDANVIYVCSFQAGGPARNPNQVIVYSDEDLTDLVPADPSDGWRWGDASYTTILLTGSFCEEAVEGGIPRLFGLYDCRVPPSP